MFKKKANLKLVAKKVDEVTIEIKDPKIGQQYKVTYTVTIDSSNAVTINIVRVVCMGNASIGELLLDKKKPVMLLKHFYDVIYNSILHCKRYRA